MTFDEDESVWSVGRRLRTEAFRTALVLPNSPRSALEAWLARVPERVGYSRPWRNLFLNRKVAPRASHVVTHKRPVREIYRLAYAKSPVADFRPLEPRKTTAIFAHQIHDYLHLAAALGAKLDSIAPLLEVTAKEIEAAKSKFGLRTEGAGEHPLFGLNPGAEYGPAKCWPKEKFVSAAREIHRRTNCVWLIFGGAAEVSIGAEIADALGHASSGARNLTGLTSLRELCALLKICRLLLTNDTGPMHMAAALGTPVVAIFGSTSPELTGPGLPDDPRHRLLTGTAPCAPCFHRICPIDFRCMKGIGAERVVEAVVKAGERAKAGTV
jgi:heptosyltransferase-2